MTPPPVAGALALAALALVVAVGALLRVRRLEQRAGVAPPLAATDGAADLTTQTADSMWAYDAGAARELDALAGALRAAGDRPVTRDDAIRRALGLACWIAAEQARGGRVLVEHARPAHRQELTGW